jgi:hypothetical protein
LDGAAVQRREILLNAKLRKLGSVLEHRDIRIGVTNMRSFLSSMLLSSIAILPAIVGLLGSEVQSSRGAGTDGIYAFCERENITDTQTRECTIKLKLEKQRLAQR